MGNLGSTYYSLGQAGQALECYQQALEIAREISDRRQEGTWLGNLGLAYAVLRREMKQAIGYCQQALEIAREIGDRQGEGNAMIHLGLAYANLGNENNTRDCLSQALAIFEEIKSPQAEQVRPWLAKLD